MFIWFQPWDSTSVSEYKHHSFSPFFLKSRQSSFRSSLLLTFLSELAVTQGICSPQRVLIRSLRAQFSNMSVMTLNKLVFFSFVTAFFSLVLLQMATIQNKSFCNKTFSVVVFRTEERYPSVMLWNRCTRFKLGVAEACLFVLIAVIVSFTCLHYLLASSCRQFFSDAPGL